MMALFVKGQLDRLALAAKRGRRTKRRLGGAWKKLRLTQASEMPLDFMLRRMRDTTAAPADQFQAAKAAAPFCHPQLQAVAHWFRDRHSHNWAL